MTHVSNPDNPGFGTDGGVDTDDYVFLLSIDEANGYFSGDAERVCYPTDLAASNGVWTSETGACGWWLRSPGYGAGDAADVYTGGSVDEGGYGVGSDNVAVRPALWLDLES